MSVQATLERGRIHVRSRRPLALKGVIPGAAWSPSKSRWSLPLSLPVCRLLREEFGNDLVVSPTLWDWAKEENRKAREMKALASSNDAELERVPTVAPRLARAMESRTYQRVGARFVAEAMANGAGCLVADQPGLGKTLEAIGGVIESGQEGPYLVVAPKTSVLSVWGREIPRWVDGQNVVTLPEGDRTVNKKTTKQRTRRDAVLDALANLADRTRDSRAPEVKYALANTWLVVHPEAVRTRVWWICGECGKETPRRHGKVQLKCGHDPELRLKDRVDHEYPQLFGMEWGAVIVDESDRALLRLSGTPTQTRQGMEMIPVRPGGLRVAMTGTPTRGRPHLLWGTLNWIDPKAHPSFWNWTELFWEVGSNGYSNHVIGKLVREEELWASLDRYVLRRTKAEAAPDMPAKNYVGTPANPDDEDSPIGVWLPMEAEQAKAYADMLATSVADLADGSRVEAIGILAELTRLKQFAGASGKMVPRERTVKCDDPSSCEDGPDPHGHRRTVMQFIPSLPSNKFEYLVQLLDELGYPDSPTTKVAVVSQWTEMLELFARELPARLQALSAHPRTPLKNSMMPVLLTGKQSSSERGRAIDEMNDPLGSGKHIMLLQTKTGGVAITLDQVDVTVILDETWVPDDQEQVEDRTHRVSRPRPVFYYYLRSLDSVDLGIALTNAERDESNKRLMDVRRGVEYARAVLARTGELSGVLVPNAGGHDSERSGGLLDGGQDGTGKARSLGSNPGRDTSTAASHGRRKAEKDSSGTLAPNPTGTVQRSKTRTQTQGGQRKMAKQMDDEAILAYKDKAATKKQLAYADWLIEKLELEFPNAKAEAAFREAVRIADALRMIFQASPENQNALAEARAAREEAEAAKAEKPKGKKSAKAKPAEDEEDEEEAPPAKPAKAAKKSAAKAAKPAAKDPEDDEDDETVATPAKKSAPRKASARSGARAPF